MADAYGIIDLNCSKNIDCDFDGLVDYLNCFDWSSPGCKWEKQFYGDGSFGIGTTRYEIPYPTVFVEYYDEDEDDYIEISLELLADNISSYITSGYIEIACEGNESNRYTFNQRLKVDSKGNASRVSKAIGKVGWNLAFEEERFDNLYRITKMERN